ncbi:MAG: GtrA family protein [Phormidesmis sp.]
MRADNSLIERLQKLPIRRLLRFGIVGFSGLFVDMAIFYLLRELIGLPLYLSTAVSIEVAIVNNFLWNDAWTFADLAQKQKGWGARLTRFYRFNLVCLTGAALQIGIMAMILAVPAVSQLTELAGRLITAAWTHNADEYFAKVLAIVLVTLWNFWLNLKLSWRT